MFLSLFILSLSIFLAGGGFEIYPLLVFEGMRGQIYMLLGFEGGLF